MPHAVIFFLYACSLLHVSLSNQAESMGIGTYGALKLWSRSMIIMTSLSFMPLPS